MAIKEYPGGSIPSFSGQSGKVLTLLNTGGTSLSGAAVTVTFSAKSQLFIFVQNASTDTAGLNSYIQFNNDSSSAYAYAGVLNSDSNSLSFERNNSNTFMPLAALAAAGGDWSAHIQVNAASSTGIKPVIYAVAASGSGAGARQRSHSGFYSGSSAITSITLTANGGNFDAGTVFVYGG